MALKRYNGSAWVVITPANMGAEPAFSKNTAFNKNFGSTAGTVCEGNDSRLSNARTPTAHTHSNSDLTGIADWAKAGTKPAYAVGEITGAAPLASPTLTGTPLAPTAAAGTNTTQLATTAFVNAEIVNDIPAWSRAASKPTYTAAEVGAAAKLNIPQWSVAYRDEAGTGEPNTSRLATMTSPLPSAILIRDANGRATFNAGVSDSQGVILSQLNSAMDTTLKVYTSTSAITTTAIAAKAMLFCTEAQFTSFQTSSPIIANAVRLVFMT